MDITGLGSAFDFTKGLLDRFWPKKATEAEKLSALAGIAPLLENRDDAVINAQKSIIVSEMQQGDKYTKRARPTVVYAGLAFIFLVNIFIPVLLITVFMFLIDKLTPAQLVELRKLETLTLPVGFWTAWTSICGIWAIGRTVEKRGVANKLINMIMGNKK
ncbi:hypothetical protein KAR91_34080 [Candidatus Pacearchaeota archaeon]|nr:hypothetical protein [Candidatus Pacearchaeota archaeon]